MAKKPKALAPESAIVPVQNQLQIENGLAQACAQAAGIGIGGGVNPFGLPTGGRAEQLSEPTTIFRNLRWWLVSNIRQVLSQAYVEIGLVQTIVDVPVDDAMRGGIEIKSKQLDESQIDDLQISLDREDDLTTAAQAAKWNRLFGGAGILTLTDQDPETPFQIELIEDSEELGFRAADMWELFYDKQNVEGYNPAIQSQDFEFYDYYGEKVHKSRVMRLKGLTAPSFVRPRLRGWGFSVVEILVRSINQYLKATDLSFEVLDEFKIDIYKIKNLTNTLMSPIGEEAVSRRLQLANFNKNYQNALIMDSEDDWDHKQLSFTGLAETMQQIRMQVASDMRMPLTKLFGISASGFSSGEEDIEVYNAMVESQVRSKIKYDLLRICEIKCQKLFGFVPDDIAIKFKPLRVLSATDEETVKTQKFARVMQAKAAGELTTLEFRDACNKGNLFDVTLDTSESGLNPDDPEIAEVLAGDKENNDPGADRSDKAKVPGAKGSGKGDNPAPKPKAAPAVAKPATPATKNIARYTREQRIDRVLTNSADFDKASYEADGGDDWIDSSRLKMLVELRNGRTDNGPLWEKAKKASEAAFGEIRWPFVTWWYEKQGGKL